jgi:outer membrane protein
MNLNRFLSVLFFCFVSFVSANSQQDGEVKVYTLNQCLQIADKQNFSNQLQEAQVEVAQANLLAAFGSYLPSANFNSGYSRRLNVDGGQAINVGGQVIRGFAPPANSYSMSAIANYTIFNGFQRETDYNTSKISVKSTETNLQQTRLQTGIDVRRAYLTVLRNSQIVEIRKENLKLGVSQLDRLKASVEIGTAQKGVVYTQEAEIGNRELDLVTAENNLNISKAQLLALMGLDPDQPAEFIDASIKNESSKNDISSFRSQVGTKDKALQTSLDNRLNIKLADLNSETSKENLRGSRSGYLPSVSASGGWSWSNSELNSFGLLGRSFVGVNLSVPLFDQFQTNARIQNAELTIKQRDIERSIAIQTVRTDVQTAFLNLDAAEKQIEISEKTVLSSEINYQISSDRFSNGLANIIDVLTANNQLVTSKINKTNAVYNYIDAQYQVLFALGVLNPQ